MVNRYITALLVVLAATGMEAQTYQQALKFALTDISYDEFIQQPEAKALEEDILYIIKAIKEVEQHIPMLESITHLSGLMGLRTVAEGVENDYQQQWLGKNNVDYLQGYQFLPPVTFNDFIRYYQQSVDLFESASDSTFSA